MHNALRASTMETLRTSARIKFLAVRPKSPPILGNPLASLLDIASALTSISSAQNGSTRYPKARENNLSA
jgi:hypothetical protein